MQAEIPTSFGGGRFVVEKELGRGGMGVVYEAFDKERDMRVALKTLHHMNTDNLYFFKREFRALHDIVHPNLCSLIELIKDENAWFLTMELISGTDFLTHIGSDPRGERLRRSLVGLCQGLYALHSAGKIHRDIKPSNVMVTDEERTVLLDFGLIAEKTIAAQTSSEAIIGSIGYMAPEQAHANNVGPEADMYSVGAMLYEALTGNLPFDGPSSKIMTEKQISDPVRPGKLFPALPGDLDALCMDLLNRHPQKRPTALDVIELLGDLETMSSVSVIPPFALGSQDIVFVGRKAELQLLASTYLETVREQASKTVVIEGVSGVGKSALIEHFSAELQPIGRDSVLLRGCCYERESAPYKAFDGIVDSLVRLTNDLSPEEAPDMTPRNVDFLLRLFPALSGSKLFSGVTLSRIEIENAQELQSRSFDAFRDLLHLLSSKHPLVMIIDNMQWVDLDSLSLLKQIMGATSVPPFFLVLVRRLEKDVENALLNWDEVLPRGYIQIQLDALDKGDSEELARLYIDREGQSLGIVAESIAEEAAGHPLYIAELVRHIASGGEEWKNVRLDEVIWSRVKALPDALRRMIRMICVAGTPIERGHLQALIGMTSEEYFRSVALLQSEKLIRSRGPRNDHLIEPYHDRVREAIVAHDLSVSEAAEIHLRIGRFFLSCYSKSELEENIFFVVQHLFSGSELISGTDERLHLAELLFFAGKKALHSSAFVSSLIYLKESIILFAAESWATHYDVMFELYCSAANAAYITGEFLATRELVAIAKARARTNLDKAKIYETYILSLIADGRPLEALNEALEIIGELGVKLPPLPTKLDLLANFVTTYTKLLTKNDDSLLRLPQNSDPQILSAKILMAVITTVTYTYRPNLNGLIALKVVELNLRHGIDYTSAYAFFAWGFFNGVFLKNYKTAYKYGQISLEMAKLFRDNSHSVKTIFSWAACIQHWLEPIKNTLDPLIQSHCMADKIGDLHYLAWSGFEICVHNFFVGEELHTLEEKFEHHGQEIQRKNVFLQYYGNRVFYQTLLNLKESSPDPTALSGPAYDETSMMPLHQKENQGSVLFNINFCHLFLGVYFDLSSDACSSIQAASKYVGSIQGTYRAAVLPFYESLACLKYKNRTDADTQKKFAGRVRKNQRKYKKIARACPANHAHKYTLVEAERARVKRKYHKAPALYEQAIAGAIEQEFTQDAALACEFAADFYREIGDEEKTMTYAKDALGHYEKWGAFAKVEHVKEKFGIE